MKTKKGFTLIELLVVISIISLLSSIVLTSMSNAKNRARNVAVMQGMREFEKLLQLEFSDTGRYTAFQGMGVWVPNISCATAFSSGTYAIQAQKICNNIDANAGSLSISSDPPFLPLHLLANNHIDTSNKYSIMAQLNGPNTTFFCVGSSGVSIYDPGSDSWGWSARGCWNNP